MKNLKYLVIDCLRFAPHPSHFNLDQALNLIEKLKPKKAILTNMHSDLDYNYLLKILPKNVKQLTTVYHFIFDEKKNIIITGGAGFVGSSISINLINYKTNYNIISIDNYSSGSKKSYKIKKSQIFKGRHKRYFSFIKETI